MKKAKPLKVAVWSVNYAPEEVGIGPHTTALCEALTGAGHEAWAVTTFSYYPSWRKRPEDAGRLYRTETIRGVRVLRCWHYVPARPSALKRIVHEATFVLASFVRQLFAPAPDVYFVISPPLLLGAAAWLLGLIRRRPFVFHVQDLQPDAARSLGMLPPGPLMRLLYGLEKIAYRKAALVGGISHGMLDVFRAKGVPAARTLFFPNTVALPPEGEIAAGGDGSFRRAHDIPEGTLLLVYSGNMGKKQGLAVLLEVAALLPDLDCAFVLCGDGAEAERLRAEVAALPPETAPVYVLPLQPEGMYRKMLLDADLCIVSEQSGVLACFLPSKLLSILALARPALLLAGAESEMVRLNEGGGFGLAVPSRDPAEIAAALRQIDANPNRLRSMGHAGRAFVSRYERGAVFPRIIGELEERFRRE
ncbi:colanic acid biosynthesis glycosyl transferase WcaI [Verrucomicrobium sp. GAS474]|uniref:glycosyltransferase n=1 Tax=Verrucomicrobium sp. GAS474 TaxID=1882831 RepID=UPI00087CCB2C|nr:glycosyltransferase [Verrucomicrobium sp. GAS474]SDT86076.1 colanic acid biosynthesis glycosyl transferase WcaI [Verrucomicrobium sp. GAS474]